MSYADYPPGTPPNLTYAQGTLPPYKVLKGDLGASIGASPSVFYRPLIGSLGASLGAFYRPLTGSPGAFYRPLTGSLGASPGAFYRPPTASPGAFYRPLTGSLGASLGASYRPLEASPRASPRCILQATNSFPRSQFTTTPRWFQIPRSCWNKSSRKSKSYGRDGPWHAVTTNIGTPAQVVDLLPCGSWMTNVLAPSACSNAGSCTVAKEAGFYNQARRLPPSNLRKRDLSTIQTCQVSSGQYRHCLEMRIGRLRP
jgi:hypothetical protein